MPTAIVLDMSINWDVLNNCLASFSTCLCSVFDGLAFVAVTSIKSLLSSIKSVRAQPEAKVPIRIIKHKVRIECISLVKAYN